MGWSDTQGEARQSSEQPVPAHFRGIGLDNLWRSLQPQTFYDSMTVFLTKSNVCQPESNYTSDLHIRSFPRAPNYSSLQQPFASTCPVTDGM